MTNLSIGSVRESSSKFLFFLAVLVVVLGVFAFYFIPTKSIYLKSTALLSSVILAFFIASFSLTGKAFISFARESVNEVSKVVWPSKRETIQSTFVVFGFVAVMAIYLCLTDKLIEWFIFSLILGWR